MVSVITLQPCLEVFKQLHIEFKELCKDSNCPSFFQQQIYDYIFQTYLISCTAFKQLYCENFQSICAVLVGVRGFQFLQCRCLPCWLQDFLSPPGRRASGSSYLFQLKSTLGAVVKCGQGKHSTNSLLNLTPFAGLCSWDVTFTVLFSASPHLR